MLLTHGLNGLYSRYWVEQSAYSDALGMLPAQSLDVAYRPATISDSCANHDDGRD